MKLRKDFNPDDILILEHGFEKEFNMFNEVSPVLVQSSLFTEENLNAFHRKHELERENYIYTRGHNPTTRLLELKLAQLEQGENAKVFASGMAAISATILSLMKQDEHILFINHCYGTTMALLDEYQKFNITYDIIYSNNYEVIKKAIKPNTKYIYFESPSSLLLDLLDIKKVSKLAKKHGCCTIFDNTISTPLLQKPLNLGVDIVIHSLSKYIGGHSDLLGGVVISSNAYIDKILEVGHQYFGACISPYTSWLILRSLRTLHVRLAYQMDSIKQIISFLQQQPQVLKINHPLCNATSFLSKQMSGYTSLLSFTINTFDYETICRFVDALKLIKIGVSWGGFESLILVVYRGNNEQVLQASNLPLNLIRLYVGLESSVSIINDLALAFKTLEVKQ
ncbi:MAG: trans-sulfuration enzyme family protein [Bacilli bacterium]